MGSNQFPDLIAALDQLDLVLRDDGRRFEIIVCGGFVLTQRYGFRKSADLDVLSPEYAASLASAAKRVHERVKDVDAGSTLVEEWVNWKAAENLGVAAGLSRGWDSRAMAEKPLYEGPTGHIVVYGLARSDMIATKLAAFLSDEREKDLEDLANLGVSLREVEGMMDDIINLLRNRSEPIRKKMEDETFVSHIRRALRYVSEHDIEIKKSELAAKEKAENS